MMFRNLVALTAICAVASFGACGEDEKENDDGGENCDPGVTYEAVGKPFVAKYCLDCHGENVDIDDRIGAPEDANFDDLAGIRDHGSHVFENVQNETMPPKAHREQPTTPERADFLDWLDCSGIAELDHH
jgi:hypothetical protein